MWKKLLFCISIFVFTIFVGYGFNHNLNASTNKYNVGGKVTGRVNMAPSGISGTHIGLQAGDHVMIGGDNEITGNPLSFQLLLLNKDYTDYDNTDTSVVVRSPISNWLTISDQVVSIPFHLNAAFYPQYLGVDKNYIFSDFTQTDFYYYLNRFNQYLRTNAEQSIIAPRSLSELRRLSQLTVSAPFHLICKKEATAVLKVAKNLPAFINYFSIGDGDYSETLTQQMRQFSSDTYNMYSHKMSNDGGTTFFQTVSNVTKADGSIMDIDFSITSTLRPYLFLDLSNIVFGLSLPNGSANRANVSDTFKVNPASAYYLQGGSPMKLRMLDSTMKIDFHNISDNKGNVLSSAVKGKQLHLNATGNTGTLYTVSALIFDSNHHFIGYQPLNDTQSGKYAYEFDTTGLAVGKYKIALVNEIYDENDTDPTYSSSISDAYPLEIVEPVSISVTTRTDLEYSKNVNNGDAVATYTISNGVNPITVSVISDTSVSSHANDYQKFTVSGNHVVVNEPNGLHSGDYYFKLNAVDSNGDPTGGVNSSTVHISVAKTSLSVAFDDSNQTKKSITEATTGWNEPATATPSNDVKVTYDKVSGDIGLIDIDSDTGAITYKGSGAYGKVTIRATADDDSSSGYDDYNPITATKEIVIYAEVNGSVTPHANSSDINTPTFTANDPNVKTGGTIGTIHGAPGTPDNVTSGEINYTFGLKSDGDGSFFAVNADNGDITTKANLSVGSYHITVTVSDKWSTKEIPVTINVGVAQAEDLKFYETSAAINAITTKSAKITDTNVTVYATVKGSSNPNQVTYKIKDGSTNVIEVNNNGDVKINGVGTVIIVAEKKGASGQADAQAELTFTVTAGAQNFIYTDNAGNELPKSGTIYNAYQEVYEPSKTFQLYTAGNPTGSTVTYQLKAGSPTDVISVDGNGLVTVLNASISPSQIGRVIVEATSHDPTGNYSDKTIELPINITKANQTISFKEITYVSNGKGSVAPIINEQDISSSDGGVSVPDTSYYISVDTSITNNIAYTNDGITIHYDYTGEDGIDIPLHVVKAGNRNYEKAEADGTLHIMSPDENILATTNMGKIVYGDHFEIRSLQDDSSSTNVQYQFEVDNTTYISNPTVSGNKAEFDALKVSGKTNITIKVTRTADGETPLSKNISVQVLPKEIEITIDDQEKLKGEPNPTLTYQDFRSELVTWNGVQDSIQENDIKLSTTAKTDSNAGSYPIKGDSNSLNKTYPNYSFSFKEGTLTIKEENIEDDWYHLEIDDGNNTAYTGNWKNQNVNIISDHSEYINISLDQSTWKPNQVTVSKEGETNQSFWMKKDSGAITKEKQETIRIDKTAPKVKGIKAKDTNNKLQDIINKLSGGIFFQPGTAFEITTDDSKDDLKVSGTKEIGYKVYKVEQQARSGDELIKEGKLTVTNEKASITISETVGKYKVCVIPTDNAGNTNKESCHEVELKKIDVDVDKDGKPDFNDPNGDGCPDLNIKWKDPNDPSKWIVINGDRDNDGVPDLNIDSDGNGKADLNIDTDNDGKPDLNLVILKKTDWKPTKCVKADIDNVILEEYCTGTGVKALINIDTDNDGVPNINIDNKGDFKPHINIAKDGKTPIINIAIIHEWKPDLNKTVDGFIFDTMAIDEKKEVLTNIDSDGDGRPDVNVDLDGDGKPDINIDTDFDWIPDINIDSDGDGKPGINVDTDKDGKPDENIVEIKEWKPNKNVDGDLPYDTMDFDEPSEPDEPTNPDEPKQPTDSSDDKDVKGYYYPGKNIGGAMTGDETNLMLHLGFMILGVGVISYLFYRYKKDTFQ